MPGGEVISLPRRYDLDAVVPCVTFGSYARVISVAAPSDQPGKMKGFRLVLKRR